MAIKGYMESSLATSEIWTGINAEGTVLEKAKNLIMTAKHIKNEDIEAAYISVKQITDSLTRAALKAFDEGRTVLVWQNSPTQSITQGLPFITLKTKMGFVTYVFMDKYISINRDGVMVLKATDLRDLLIGAVISTGIKTNYSNLTNNQYLQKILMDLYTKFLTRILNRQYAFMSDRVCFDTVQYWINKFFLTQILAANNTPENIEIMSSQHFKYIDELKAEEIKQAYIQANPSKISDLLALIKTSSPRMKTLGLGVVLNDWMQYYYIPSVLAIDNVEYLIFMITTLLSGNGIISIAASDIVKEQKNIKSLRSELLKLI